MRLVDALHESASVNEPLWRELRAHFEPDQIVERLVLAGFYHTISFVTNAFALELEPGAERFPDSRGVGAGPLVPAAGGR